VWFITGSKTSSAKRRPSRSAEPERAVRLSGGVSCQTVRTAHAQATHRGPASRSWTCAGKQGSSRAHSRPAGAAHRAGEPDRDQERRTGCWFHGMPKLDLAGARPACRPTLLLVNTALNPYELTGWASSSQAGTPLVLTRVYMLEALYVPPTAQSVGKPGRAGLAPAVGSAIARGHKELALPPGRGHARRAARPSRVGPRIGQQWPETACFPAPATVAFGIHRERGRPDEPVVDISPRLTPSATPIERDYRPDRQVRCPSTGRASPCGSARRQRQVWPGRGTVLAAANRQGRERFAEQGRTAHIERGTTALLSSQLKADRARVAASVGQKQT